MLTDAEAVRAEFGDKAADTLRARPPAGRVTRARGGATVRATSRLLVQVNSIVDVKNLFPEESVYGEFHTEFIKYLFAAGMAAWPLDAIFGEGRVKQGDTVYRPNRSARLGGWNPKFKGRYFAGRVTKIQPTGAFPVVVLFCDGQVRRPLPEFRRCQHLELTINPSNLRRYIEVRAYMPFQVGVFVYHDVGVDGGSDVVDDDPSSC